MAVLVFISVLLLSFGIFFLPKRAHYLFALVLALAMVSLTSFWAVSLLSGSREFSVLTLDIPMISNVFMLVFDKLSAFFIIVVNITIVVGLLYARGYLKPYYNEKNALSFSMHYFAYLWLYFSMLLVVGCRDGLSFLISWEVMAISSFLLVIFDAEDRNIMKTGINYLIQMHVGMAILMIALILVEKDTGSMSFDALPAYFTRHSNWPLFLLFFAGFAIKAGFIPLHTWLPQAHPAAPSHVSGVMSGVMIKMGIYGMFRVLVSVQTDLLVIGVVVLVLSLISGLLGVMMAIVQHDLKRLLAYHSIENIGIIGMGMGLGIIGKAIANPQLMLLGFGGSLLHVLNHSLFKSLLFFNAGSVFHATHTRNIEQTGGLMKKMPYTALLFLVGSLAICGLPPFNGFISEYLIFYGMFQSLSGAGLYQAILLLFSIIGLSLIGGLAIFCFTKAFGIVFLGEPRSQKAADAVEVSRGMILPQLVTVFFIVAVGLASAWFVKPVFGVVADIFPVDASQFATIAANLSGISLAAGVFVLVAVALLVLRYYYLKRKTVRTGPIWGCGYTAATPKLQYTATSYADNYHKLAKPLIRNNVHSESITDDEIFPPAKSFETHSEDVFKTRLTDAPVNRVLELLKKIAVMQTGQIQHYILYAFVFMLLIFLLTYFNLI
ncbi:MAG: NADH-quinone oxidoreductase subunit E [Bacteroidales bacterium]|nr:NADH-quinone oxidoreductase subunit E [Bacteroidales bacterium]